MTQQHIGFLVVSNNHFNDFRYPLIQTATGHAIKMPGSDTASVLLTVAKKQGAKLMLSSVLDTETKSKVQKIWGKP